MKVKNNDIITVSKKLLPPIPYYQLVDKYENLLEKPKKIFISWFYKFADPYTKMMSPINLSDFCQSCTSQLCIVSDLRIKTIFEKYDKNKDGFLELNDFLEFYKNSSIDKPSDVWRNL